MINPQKHQKIREDSGDDLKRTHYDVISATKDNDIEEVKAAIRQDNSCVNDSDDNGMSALHWAAALNNYAISEILLQQKKTEKEKLDNFGRQPMQLALENNNEKLSELFFRHIFPEVYEQDDPYNSEKKVVDIRPKGTEPS